MVVLCTLPISNWYTHVPANGPKFIKNFITGGVNQEPEVHVLSWLQTTKGTSHQLLPGERTLAQPEAVTFCFAPKQEVVCRGADLEHIGGGGAHT